MIELEQPTAIPSERAVIGAVLVSPAEVLPLCHEKNVTQDTFNSPECRLIYEHILELERDGRQPDLLMVAASMDADGSSTALGGSRRLEELVDAVPTVAYAGQHIDEIVACHARRVVMMECASCAERASKERDHEAILSDTITRLASVQGRGAGKSLAQIKSEAMEKYRAAAHGAVAGIPSPWKRFNERFGGLQKGVVSLLAARQSVGKSSAVKTWVEYLANPRNGVNLRIGWCPFEDGNERTWERLAASYARVSAFSLSVGNATEDEIERVGVAYDEVMKWPIFMEDRHMDGGQLCSWMVRAKNLHGINVFFIDAWKDIMRKSGDVEEDDRLSKMICATARRLDVPVLVSHHVRKQGTAYIGAKKTRQQMWLTMEDIRGSGNVSNDARQVIILQHWQDGEDKLYELDLAKNSYGPTGHWPIHRVDNLCEFVEPTPQEEFT